MNKLNEKEFTHFAIGGPNAIEEGFTHGPTTHITELLEEWPDANAFIYKLNPNGNHERLYRWREETGKWVRINK